MAPRSATLPASALVWAQEWTSAPAGPSPPALASSSRGARARAADLERDEEDVGPLQRLDVHGLERGGRGDGLHVHTGELEPGQVGGVEGESGAGGLVEADGGGAAGDLAHAGRAGR